MNLKNIIEQNPNDYNEHEKSFDIGDIVQHFKRERLDENADRTLYLYKILNFAWHTETNELMVVYEALYSCEALGVDYDVYVRPFDMFMGEVDHEKYPYIKQKYRFEKI